MRRLPALVAALLLPAAPPVLMGIAVVSATLLVSQAPAQAQSAEDVAKIAQAITVRVEGAIQGSGVLVKREGNRYTVLTAWHVVSGQRPGEEVDIYTPDGQRHPIEQGSIKRVGEVDMAVLTFTSASSYEVAPVGDVKSVSSGSSIYVAGFPLPTSAVPSRIFRFLKGDVIANATVAIPNGYQLLYSNPTLPGMSGGAVLDAQGQLVGIHASAERADQISESNGKAVATGANQAVPIIYYRELSAEKKVSASPLAIPTDQKLTTRERIANTPLPNADLDASHAYLPKTDGSRLELLYDLVNSVPDVDKKDYLVRLKEWEHARLIFPSELVRLALSSQRYMQRRNEIRTKSTVDASIVVLNDWMRWAYDNAAYEMLPLKSSSAGYGVIFLLGKSFTRIGKEFNNEGKYHYQGYSGEFEGGTQVSYDLPSGRLLCSWHSSWEQQGDYLIMKNQGVDKCQQESDRQEIEVFAKLKTGKDRKNLRLHFSDFFNSSEP